MVRLDDGGHSWGQAVPGGFTAVPPETRRLVSALVAELEAAAETLQIGRIGENEREVRESGATLLTDLSLELTDLRLVIADGPLHFKRVENSAHDEINRHSPGRKRRKPRVDAKPRGPSK